MGRHSADSLLHRRGADKLDEAASAIAKVAGELDAVHSLTGAPALGRPVGVAEIEATAVRES